MMTLQLSVALNNYDHVRDVLSGTIRPDGIELLPLELPIEEIFYRFTRFREWDVSEMSFGKVVSLMSEERPDIVALPVTRSSGSRSPATTSGRTASSRTGRRSTRSSSMPTSRVWRRSA